MTLEWQEPPNDRRGNSEFQAILRQLKANPGKWALVRRDAMASAATSFRRHRCIVTSRSVGGGKYNIYAMWPGDET